MGRSIRARSAAQFQTLIGHEDRAKDSLAGLHRTNGECLSETQGGRDRYPISCRGTGLRHSTTVTVALPLECFGWHIASRTIAPLMVTTTKSIRKEYPSRTGVNQKQRILLEKSPEQKNTDDRRGKHSDQDRVRLHVATLRRRVSIRDF